MVDKTLQVQHQIRANAEEVSSFLSDISKWEKSMKDAKKNTKSKKTISKTPLRQGFGTVPVRITANSVSQEAESTSDSITPSDIVRHALQTNADTHVQVPKARGQYVAKDPEEEERNRGNQEFKNGNFPSAVKFYTKCLGLKSRNFIAFSNRAMAYIKMKEFHRAVNDCDCALSIEPEHVKSLSRRASALNALGRHRAAVRDLTLALSLEPTNKQVRVDLQSSRELLRSAVNRAPMVALACRSSSSAVLQGPDLPTDLFKQSPEIDENLSNFDINSSYLPSPPEPGTVAQTEVVPLVPSRVEEKVEEKENITISSSTSRIAISEDSDSEDEIIEAGISTISITASDEKNSEAEQNPPVAMESDIETHSKVEVKATKKPTKKATPTSTPSKDSTLQLNTVFELQRLLEKALADSSGSTVNAFFDSLEESPGASAAVALSSSSGLVPSPVKSKKASSTIGSGNKKASKVSSKISSNSSDPLQQLQRLLGPLMEPDLLLLFLRAVGSRINFQLQTGDWSAISRSLFWLEWVSGSDGCRSFSLLLSLLSSQERQNVRAPLLQLEDHPVDTVRVTALLSVFKE